jgi:hypothetical protein
LANKKEKKPPQVPEPKKKIAISRHILSWAVFIPTITVVFISLVAVVFPALIIRSTSPLQSEAYHPDVIDPFQAGILAAPLIAANIVVLAIGISYYRREKMQEIFRSITSFELSRKQALIAVVVVLAIFCSITAGTLAKEETWADYENVKKRVDSWSPSQFAKSFEPHTKYLFLWASLKGLGNIRILPFIISFALLVQTYFFTKDITGKRFAGIISMILVLQSDVFVSYSTTASYENSWILLFLFSLYLVQRFWPPSPAPYLLSIFSKALTVAFLPMSLYFIARSSLPRRSKIYSLISYGIIAIILGVAAAVYKTNLTGGSTEFDGAQFWQGFAAMAMQMRFDYIVVLFVLPVTVLLFFQSRKGILHADSMLIFILVILLAAPFLTGFTTQTNQPYRFVSLSVFFAIGVGILLSNKTRKAPELSSST